MAYANQLSRAIAIADYILEEEGHKWPKKTHSFTIVHECVFSYY